MLEVNKPPVNSSFFFQLYEIGSSQLHQTYEASLELLRNSKSLISWQSASFGKIAFATVMIGNCVNLGATAIAAFNLASVTVYLLSLPTILLQACESIINQSPENPDLVAINFKRALCLSVLTGLCTMALLYWLPLPLFTLLGQSPQIRQMIATYCAFIGASIIPTGILKSQISVVNAGNDRAVLFPLSILSFTTWLISTYLLMNVYGFGLNSIALGYIIDASVSALYLGLYLRFSEKFKNFPLLGNFSWDAFNFKAIIYYSFPFSYDYITRSVMMFARKSCLALLGIESLVIEQIAFQWLGFSDLITEGVNQTATVKIAQYSEEEKIKHRHQIGNANLMISFVVCTALIVPLLTMPKAVASIYLNQAECDNLNTKISLFFSFAVVSVYKMLLKLNYAMTSNLLGTLDTNMPNIINGISSAAISSVLAFCLAGYLSLNFYTLFSVFIVGSSISSGLIYNRWESKNTEANTPGEDNPSVWQYMQESCRISPVR